MKSSKLDEMEEAAFAEDSQFMRTVQRWAEIEQRKRRNAIATFDSDIRIMVIEYQSESEQARVTLRPGQVKTFGRSSSADQKVSSDPCVSGRHFSIECDSRGGVIRDLGSSNGTFVDGERVSEAELNNGAEIIAGMTVFSIDFAYA